MMVILGYIILLRRNIILMSRIKKIKVGSVEKWYGINDKVSFEMVK